ncbi:MAG: hypothetical protein K8H87_08605 [Pseudorhodoplanes sp.]|nr:hypothetical protein [Pseudorhodoplanes sp.]
MSGQSNDDRKKDNKQLESDRKGRESDRATTSAIGSQLKRLYDQVAQEPVPDRFTKLLEQLAKQESDREEE